MNGYLDRLSGEDRLFASHVEDMAELCGKNHTARFSAFLDGRQRNIAESVLGGMGFENSMFFGGYDGAERVVLGVFPPYSDCDESAFPMKCLSFIYRKEDRLSHRDFLGSFTACGIDRSMIGDIIVNDGYTAAFVYNTAADALMSEIRKIGRTGVKILAEDNPVISVSGKFAEINGTVPSLRTDCVIGLAVKLSREKTARLIRAGSVSVNYAQSLSVSDEMKCGDIFSVRGYGKFILSSIDGKTKKDRLHICIKKYI